LAQRSKDELQQDASVSHRVTQYIKIQVDYSSKRSSGYTFSKVHLKIYYIFLEL
jgi:cell fate (sporulation/competence/biofilm development) regulator YlbF (YheA/YmcA/DUF963 family)